MENSIILRFLSSNPKLKQINYKGRSYNDQKIRFYCFKDLYGLELGINNKFQFFECDKFLNATNKLNISEIKEIEWYTGGEEMDNEFRVWLSTIFIDKIVGRR